MNEKPAESNEDLMKEKRTLKRRHLIFYLAIIDKETLENLGYVGDINSDGIMIVSEKEIPLRKVYNVRIKLPDVKEFSEKNLYLTIKTLWTKLDKNPDIKCYGARFIDISDDDKLLINLLIRFLGFEN